MKHKVFISYRTKGEGTNIARLLKEKLETDFGISIFMDVTDLRDGRFDEQLIKKIKNCDKVILVLTPGALNQCNEEEDWVRTEIEYALKYHKIIIPVIVMGFIWPERGEVPDSVYKAVHYQGVKFSIQYLDATIQKLAKYIGVSFWYHLHKKVKLLYAVVTLFVLMALIVFIVTQQDRLGENPPSTFDVACDEHLVIALENANHQYVQGLKNWKRLDYARAESDILIALEEISGQFAQSKVEVAKVNNSLGCLYLDMGKYEDAYDYLNRAYVTFEEVYGAESIEARAVQFSIAQYDYYTGDNATALKMCEAILDATDVTKDKIVITAVKHFKAKILDEQGQWEEALDVYREVLGLYVDDNGKLLNTLTGFVYNSELGERETDYSTNAARWAAITYNAMGCVYIHMQDYTDARKALDAGMKICSNNIYIGEKDLITADIYQNLAVVYGHRGELRRGMDCIDYAKRIICNIFDFKEEYPGLVEVYEVYGDQYLLADDDAQAFVYYNKALCLAVDAYGENHPQTAEAYNVLGMYYQSIADYKLAINYFQKAIDIRKNILGYNYVDTAKYYVNLAKAQAANKERDNANESLLYADEICKWLGIEGTLADEIRQLSEEVSSL